MTAGRDELILTSASRALRRSVGPTAWVVLEALTADAVGDGDDLVVITSLRRLADELGLGRDAVAGAVQALAFAGRLRVESTRDDGGRFGASRYVVLAGGALRRVSDDAPGPSRAAARRPTRPPQRQQLTLLDALDPAPTSPSPTSPSPAPTRTRASRP